MGPQGLFDFTLNYNIITLNPNFVRTSIGLKYFTSPGLKNIYLIVARLRFILKG